MMQENEQKTEKVEMKKITIRKAGPIRLTSLACSHYPTV